MKFPVYPTEAYKTPPIPVVRGYINFFGAYEADNREGIASLRKTDINQITMRLGRGCLIAADGNDKAADRVFKRAQRDLTLFVDTNNHRRSPLGRLATRLLDMARMLEHRDDAAAVAEARQQSHLRTIGNVDRVHNQLTRTDDRRPLGGRRGDLHGELVQDVTLGLLTRYSAHPWAMGQPALVHHDMGKIRRRNFDVLHIETSAETEYTASHKIQVKSACLGTCATPQAVTINRGEYNSDIVFVSGCCDLGFKGPSEERDYTLAKLLIREAQDDISPDELATLDTATGALMLSTTMEHPSRMGLHPLEVSA